MKQIFIFLFLQAALITGHGQNMGVGVPNPQQKLDVNGALRIGNTSSNVPGSIRYNDGRFEGGDGSIWNSFEGLPKGSIIFSKKNPNPNLSNAGYNFFGEFNYTFTETLEAITNSETWYPVNKYEGVPESDLMQQIFWTGSEFLVTALNLRKYDPVNDVWKTTSTNDNPSFIGTSVFTGSELITIGNPQSGNLPAKYDPIADVWTIISSAGVPDYNQGNTAVWTGIEMIVFGGNQQGAKYNAATNTWSQLSTVNAPQQRINHAAVWTGTEMLIWGGVEPGSSSLLNSGARYNPITNTWAPMAASPLSPRVGFTYIWAGSELIITGGGNDLIFPTETYADAARYNPATNSWTSISLPSFMHNLLGSSAVWTSNEIIFWGGRDLSYTPISGGQGDVHNEGVVFNPATNIWSILNQNEMPFGRIYHGACWNGTLMLILNGIIGFNGFQPNPINDGSRYFRSSGFNINISELRTKLFLFIKN